MAVERLNSQCISCLLNKHLKDFPDDFSTSKKTKYMKGILKIIGNANKGVSAPEIVEQINVFKEKNGITTDFSKIKKFYNDYLLSMEMGIEQKLAVSRDPLKLALQYAMAGNYIDFGSMKTVDEPAVMETLLNAKNFKIGDVLYECFKSEISEAKSIVYLIDNCGEIVLDKLLIKQILKFNNNVKITAVVRGKPVLNDCTLEDAKYVGLDKIVEVIDNGTGIAGTVLSKITPQALNAIENADIIISKGQGNFETLHHCGKNIYYIFLCKCKMFAERFGVDAFTGMFVNDKRLK